MENPDALSCIVQSCALHPGHPNKEEMSNAIARWVGLKLTTCIVCGLALKVSRYRLHHEPRMWGPSDTHDWEVFDFQYSDPAITLRTRFEEGGLHLSCLRSALPHATWLSEAEAEFTEKAKAFDSLNSTGAS